MIDRDIPAVQRDPEAPVADTEQLVVGQDARDRRLKFKRWGRFACAPLFIIIALTAAFWLPFFIRDSDNKNRIPSKIVVADKRIFLSLGYPAFGGKEGSEVGGGGGGSGAGDLVSFVQLESEASVNDVTIQVVGVDFTERQRKDEYYRNDEYYVNILKNDAKNKDKDHRSNDDDEEEDDLEEPGLMFGSTKGDTGTHIEFRVGRSKRHPIERAQLRLKITVPLKFDGELSIEGTQLHIESGVSLAQARFSLLHLTAHTGDFVLMGSANDGDDDNNKDNGDRRSPHGGKKTRNGDEPVLRVSTLNAQITHKGSITVGPLKSAVSGKPVRARLETQQGDISLIAITTMITLAKKDQPWEFPDEEELVHYFNPTSHSKGDVHLDIRQGELDDDNDEENGYWIGKVFVQAQAEEGSVTGRVDLSDYQLVSINADCYADTILEVADLFMGDVAVTASQTRKATVLQKDDGETIIRYSHSESSKKLGYKGFPNHDDSFSLGNVGLHSTHGSATLIFS
ncbi:hypothetical protein BGZ47_003940 [Haplosporangium gracile]|nr:hypothetical protein BGZ47_003940 [Haplosporangium gracile]